LRGLEATEVVGCLVVAGTIEKIKQWFHRSGVIAEEDADGGLPVATPAEGLFGDSERETSTNAQTAAASDEPWPGND
jgi:hypothetical protein